MKAALILGGGPSVADLDLSLLGRASAAGHTVIAVNRSYELWPASDVHFFADCSFADEHWAGVMSSPIKRRVTLCRRWATELRAKLLVRGRGRPLDTTPGHVSATNSGTMAANWSINEGHDVVILLGMDLREVDGRKHWHDGYRHKSPPKTCEQMLEEWRGIRAASEALGRRILHGTPGSALDEVEYRPLRGILRELV